MEITQFDINKSCHVNTKDDGDRFVGVKIEEDKATVYFPLGYELPSDDKKLRREIRSLFSILSTFTNKEDKVLKGNKFVQAHPVDFPIVAFLDVMDYYKDNNGKYYTVTKKKYKSDTKGKIDWKRTAKIEKAFIKNGAPIYTNFQVEYQSPLENELITIINKLCVYEAFKKIGWIYTNLNIPNPGIILRKKEFTNELRKQLRDTQKDRDKKLFKSMIAMIEFIDNRILDKSFYFGTDKFEYVWEKLIDKIFGIVEKEDYFPTALWSERHGANKDTPTRALMPDTIMIYNDKFYILDAKYYRYGATHQPGHLPNSSSISKQITYAEYVNQKKRVDSNKLFNAFIMPFNMYDNLFEIDEKDKSIVANVAEAHAEWKANSFYYEKIQGILVDIRYMMLNYLGNHDADKELLASAIEKYLINEANQS